MNGSREMPVGLAWVSRALKRRLGAGARRPLRTRLRAEPALQGTDTRRRLGFTLIELLVALTIAGTVAVLAHRMFVGVADGAARVEEARIALDREMNARRLITELVGSLDVGTSGAAEFRGERARVAFSTWALAPEGWPRRYAVTLTVADSALELRGLGDDVIELARPVESVAFDYLLEPGATEHWVRQWISPVSAPAAIRMRVAKVGCGMGDAGCVDTLLLIVGSRG